MRTWLLALLTFNLSFLTIDCGLDVEDSTPPSPPVWVQKSLPEEWPELGIDAHESGGIYLQWEETVDDDIIAYSIFRATWNHTNDSLSDYQRIIRLESEVLGAPEFIDQGAESRTRYSYKLNSQDAANNFSDYSEPISYSLLPALPYELMHPSGIADTLTRARTLFWQNYYVTEVEDYCVTLLTLENELVLRQILIPRNYVGGWESWKIPPEINLPSGQGYKWRIDVLSGYSEGYETVSSESFWVIFFFSDN